MKYQIKPSSTYKKELKKAFKQGKDLGKLNRIINMLANDETLPASNRDHQLTGVYKGFRECHIELDWLLIYQKEDTELLLYLVRTGSHSELF